MHPCPCFTGSRRRRVWYSNRFRKAQRLRLETFDASKEFYVRAQRSTNLRNQNRLQRSLKNPANNSNSNSTISGAASQNAQSAQTAETVRNSSLMNGQLGEDETMVEDVYRHVDAKHTLVTGTMLLHHRG